MTEARMLTEGEVNALPEGAPITVTWSGGNGPHDYVVAVDPLRPPLRVGPGHGRATPVLQPTHLRGPGALPHAGVGPVTDRATAGTGTCRPRTTRPHAYDPAALDYGLRPTCRECGGEKAGHVPTQRTEEQR